MRVKVLKGDGVEYIKEGDAGIDLRASGDYVVNLDSEKKEVTAEEYEIEPGERILIKTGVEVAIPEGCWGNIRDRSGLAFKHGLHTLAGVIDETYRGEIGVVMVNLGEEPYTIKKNERIAQMIIQPYKRVDVEEVDEHDSTVRGESGFGDSGRK